MCNNITSFIQKETLSQQIDDVFHAFHAKRRIEIGASVLYK